MYVTRSLKYQRPGEIWARTRRTAEFSGNGELPLASSNRDVDFLLVMRKRSDPWIDGILCIFSDCRISMNFCPKTEMDSISRRLKRNGRIIIRRDCFGLDNVMRIVGDLEGLSEYWSIVVNVKSTAVAPTYISVFVGNIFRARHHTWLLSLSRVGNIK